MRSLLFATFSLCKGDLYVMQRTDWVGRKMWSKMCILPQMFTKFLTGDGGVIFLLQIWSL